MRNIDLLFALVLHSKNHVHKNSWHARSITLTVHTKTHGMKFKNIQENFRRRFCTFSKHYMSSKTSHNFNVRNTYLFKSQNESHYFNPMPRAVWNLNTLYLFGKTLDFCTRSVCTHNGNLVHKTSLCTCQLYSTIGLCHPLQEFFPI